MRRATWATIGGTAASGLAAMLARRAVRRGRTRGELAHRRLDNLRFVEALAGVSRAVLHGDPDHGPYFAVTRFEPGAAHPKHKHSNDIHLFVLSGAYLYEADGQQIRVGANEYLFLPGGNVHKSGADPIEGCVFIEHSSGGFDLITVD